MILAIDPGVTNGAAVLMDGEHVHAWWTWQRLQRKSGKVFRLTDSNGSVTTHDMLWQLASHIRISTLPFDTLAIEGLFIPKRDGKVKVQEQLVLAESIGELIAGLHWSGDVSRPAANKWRPYSAGIRASMKRGAAEAEAVKRAAVAFRGLQLDAPTKAERGALAEACFIGKHAQRYAQSAPRGHRDIINTGRTERETKVRAHPSKRGSRGGSSRTW